MKKKLLIISLAIVIILVAYLLAAHHLIYASISRVGLEASDITHQYVVKQDAKDSLAGLVYTAIGDSLTAGVGVIKYEDSYPYQIAQKVAGSSGQATLTVQAYPGARTSDVIRDLLTPAINNNPDIVTLLIGVNDVHGFVSKIKFAKNYQEILTRLKTETKAKIYVISIPYIGTDSLLLPPYNYYLKHETIEFNKIIQNLAKEDNVEYVDLFTPTENMFKDSASYSADLFHPSIKGYGIWADAIYADINK